MAHRRPVQRYLVIIDHDGPHDALLAELRALGRADESCFHLVVAVAGFACARTQRAARVAAQEQLTAIEALLAEVHGVDGELCDGHVYTAISDAMAQHDYDALVVATPSIGELEQRRLVSGLVRTFGRPVVLVKPVVRSANGRRGM